MNREEAMTTLQAMRPNGADELDPAFTEALTLIEADAELKLWWAKQQAFDRVVAAKLADLPLPAHLREKILAGNKIVPLRPQSQMLGWLAIAAMVAILCVAGTFLEVSKYGPVEEADYNKAVLPLLNHDKPALAMFTTDHDKITSWLESQNAPVGSMPEKVAALPSVGCQRFTVHGHLVSLICFTMPNGHLAHLLIADERTLMDPPNVGAPKFASIDGWSTAAWSDGKMTYLLATQADSDSLRQLL